MKALARALINAVAFLELSAEEGLDSETALRALEEISYNLSYCTDDEKQIIEDTLAEMRDAEMENGPRVEVLEMLDTFMASFGLEEDPDLEDTEAPERINLL